ncbi:hypothetical protein FOA52_013983 [Chlamydomonas sp. UWO 241]|nr:hypothetical protein FOA52_013983 [Chlamydomonas sp. UWO 241]
MDVEPDSKQLRRKEQLTTLLELRRLYLSMVHASACLRLPAPVYQPLADSDEKSADAGDEARPDATTGAEAGGSPVSTSGSESDEESERESAKEREMIAEERKAEALSIVSAMSRTSEQLRASLRALSPGFAWVFEAGSGAESERAVIAKAKDLAQRLKERVAEEIPQLPLDSPATAQALIDGLGNGPSQSLQSGEEGGVLGSQGPGTVAERLELAEKVAEAFVQRRIKPALRRAREQDPAQLLRGTGVYLKGLWVRLNGGRGDGGGAASGVEQLALPLPKSTAKDSELAISQLGLELEALETRLQDASKQRENKLRKAGLPGRVQMAVQLRGLDAKVVELSQLLAVRTLQLEMEFVYRSLEDEALDLGGGPPDDVTAKVDADMIELQLLVADFVLLDEQLQALSAALSVGSASSFSTTAAVASATVRNGGPVVVSVGGGGSSHGGSGGGEGVLGLLGEDMLETLASEIPDMRVRVGVVDQVVFGGQGFSVTRLQLQGADALSKVREAIDFMVCGVRLLGSDIANAGRLFTRAAQGRTLKQREVSALRRTARDIFTFIPFTIILIVPITPLGHVLVYSLIQTYFPQFYPSCFTKKRQEIMVKYDALQRQLIDARAQADQVAEEAELSRAAAAVARLTCVTDGDSSGTATASSGSGDEAEGGGGPLGGGGALNGAAAAVAAAAAGVPTLLAARGGDGRADADSVDDDSTVESEEKVRVLEEKLSRVLRNVNLGDGAEEAEDEARSSSSRKNGSGRSGATKGGGWLG